MDYQQITSSANPRVKEVMRLRDRKTRQKEQVTVIEGFREVERAIDAGVSLREIYFCRGDAGSKDCETILKMASKFRVPVFELKNEVFTKIAYGEREEGILAVGVPREISLKELTGGKDPIYVVVEGVEKPGNLGAILRTCDAAGVNGVIICDGKTDLYNPNVIRASIGTVFTVKATVSSNDEALKFLRSQKAKICATLPAAKTAYIENDLTGAIGVIVGSEREGLSPFWAKHADLKVKIPMKGRADSLNVSATTAILLYEIARQRSR